MGRAIHQVLASVPLRGLRRVVLVGAGLMEQTIPQQHERTHAKRKAHVGLWCGLRHRRALHQPGVERRHVVIADAGKRGVGERGIQRMAIARDALAHGPLKGLVGPSAQTSVDIGCEIAAVDRAKTCFEGLAARKRLALVAGVAGDAVAQGRYLRAARQHRLADGRQRCIQARQTAAPAHTGSGEGGQGQQGTTHFGPAPALGPARL